ncbi:acyl carrier protein [Stenotrophomonas sp. 169]|uniref:acyl carrier protein n=1 Tax=Stenotrophomonas sp. 169 TaxID=2770322 RepID=UPI0016623E62|nr:acyl carrier protein [Stenotrophomonas sp. 169]QNR97288.1 acyl carrier protein [Stenotrophomonas sp. 169]
MRGPDTPITGLRPLIAVVTGSVAVADIRPGDRLVEDLGLDSLEIADLLVAIEERTGVVITAEALAGARTVAELESAVRRLQCTAA